jgi:DNA polymerase III alpha subunit
MNSEYGQNSPRENSIEQRKSMEELKRMNQPNCAPQQTVQSPQAMQPIVIQCDLPQAMNKLTEQADGINWELEEIRNILPELKTRIDLTPVQKSLAEMQRSLTEMSKLLEQVGNLSEKYSCKWIRWLPDFSLLVATKWIMLVLILGTAALAGWYGVAAIRGLFL